MFLIGQNIYGKWSVQSTVVAERPAFIYTVLYSYIALYGQYGTIQLEKIAKNVYLGQLFT